MNQGTPLERVSTCHEILYTDDPGNAREKRFFSTKCMLFWNKGGCCPKCTTAKYQLERVKKRRASFDTLAGKMNNRYMSREEPLDKLTQEKQRRLREQKARERVEKEMLEMDPEDHQDLANIMKNVRKEDVPEEMSILWEQQKQIIGTASSRAKNM